MKAKHNWWRFCQKHRTHKKKAKLQIYILLRFCIRDRIFSLKLPSKTSLQTSFQKQKLSRAESRSKRYMLKNLKNKLHNLTFVRLIESLQKRQEVHQVEYHNFVHKMKNIQTNNESN